MTNENSNPHEGSKFQDDSWMLVDPDGHVHTIPLDGTKHVENTTCWCEPILMDDYSELGGCRHYLHRETQ